jgi:hypothetical protein
MNSFEKKAFKHCCNGTEEAFIALVPAKVDINYQISTFEFNRIILENPSFLHCAATHGKEKMAMLLVDLGINLDLRDGKGVSFCLFTLLLLIELPLP